MSKTSKKPVKSLTPKEKAVLEYLEQYFLNNDISPSYKEIKDHFGYASYFSVQRYLKQLEEKSYISLGANNEKRAITLVAGSDQLSSRVLASKTIANKREEAMSSQAPSSLSLPLLGKVAAGSPIEHIKYDELLDVPQSMVKSAHKSFVLQVEGDSMIEDGIFDGDFLIVEKDVAFHKGDTIVAMVDNEATVKNLYIHKSLKSKDLSPDYSDQVKRGNNMELRPANSSMKSMFFKPQQVDIQGKVVGLLRNYN